MQLVPYEPMGATEKMVKNYGQQGLSGGPVFPVTRLNYASSDASVYKNSSILANAWKREIKLSFIPDVCVSSES